MYVDSAVLVKLVVREPDSGFYADLLDGQRAVIASELSIPECRSALLRKAEYGDITLRTCEQAWTKLQAFWATRGGLSLKPVSRSVLEEAGDMMRQCAGCASIRTLDAIHLATCRFAHAYPLVTNDRIMRKAAERIGIPLGPLPTLSA